MKIDTYVNEGIAVKSCIKHGTDFRISANILRDSEISAIGIFTKGTKIIFTSGACHIIVADEECKPIDASDKACVVSVPAGRKISLNANPEVGYYLITR